MQKRQDSAAIDGRHSYWKLTMTILREDSQNKRRERHDLTLGIWPLDDSSATLPELNPVSGPRGFPTELTPRGTPCCIVRIFEECRVEAFKQLLILFLAIFSKGLTRKWLNCTYPLVLNNGARIKDVLGGISHGYFLVPILLPKTHLHDGLIGAQLFNGNGWTDTNPIESDPLIWVNVSTAIFQ